MFQATKSRFFIFIFALIVFAACTSKRKLVYFQGDFKSGETSTNYSPLLRSDDILSITVLGLDERAVKPFNLPLMVMSQNVGGYSQGSPTPPGYLIDAAGEIDFPVVGKIKLAGLTRGAAVELIKEKLKPYLTDHTVMIRILNYKITVLGDVKHPGTFTIPNERVTLPEAIGIAGDLEITGTRKNVIVIRDIDGKKTETRVDLTTKDLFSSPVYYLQQNDVVYVEPNRAKANSSVINPSNASLIISSMSLLVTIMILLSK